MAPAALGWPENGNVIVVPLPSEGLDVLERAAAVVLVSGPARTAVGCSRVRQELTLTKPDGLAAAVDGALPAATSCNNVLAATSAGEQLSPRHPTAVAADRHRRGHLCDNDAMTSAPIYTPTPARTVL